MDKPATTLADRLEIQDLLTRYCTAIDTRSFELLDTVFTADGVGDYTASGGIRAALPELKQWLAQALSAFTVIQHMVANFVIEIDGDSATSSCYLFNPLGFPGDSGATDMLFCGGLYRDRLVRTGQGWRIRERVIDMLYMHGRFPPR